MAATTMPSATAPRMPVAATAAQGMQRECTLCGRVVTNCAAHAGFTAAEGLSLSGVGYAVYLGSMALGVISGGFFLAAAMGQFCWYRYRNVQALGDAASEVGNAADATLAAAGHLEQGALQGAETSRRTSVAARQVLGAAEQLAAAISAGHSGAIAGSAEEIGDSVAGVATVATALPLQLEEFRQLLGTTSSLSRDMRAALADIKKAIRSNSSEIAQIADLETRFEVASRRLSDGLTSDVECLKQVLMMMAETSNLAMQIMRANNVSLVASLAEKSAELAQAVALADVTTSRMAASDQERVALAERLLQLERDNEALHVGLIDTLARLEAERSRWEVAAPTATAAVTEATSALSGERRHWEETLIGMRGLVAELASLRGAGSSTLAGVSDSSRAHVTTGEAKTGE